MNSCQQTYSIILFGGLGNQLFQLAAAYAETIRLSARLIIPPEHCGPTHDSTGNQAIQKIIEQAGLKGPLQPDTITFPKGYYQSTEYFWDNESDILQLLSPLLPQSQRHSRIALHLRMGDYLKLPDYHPLISPHYIHDSISWQMEQGAEPILDIYTNSPSLALDYVRPAIQDLSVTLNLAEQATSVEHLKTLAGYNHLIGSNSSFSWWAAWLHRAVNPEGYLTLPSKWFGSQYKGEWSSIYSRVTKGVLSVI